MVEEQIGQLEPIDEVSRSVHFSRFVVQPILISLMISSVLGALLAVINLVAIRIPWLWIYPIVLFVTLEGVYTTLWIDRPGQRLLNKTSYRLAESLIILVAIRLITWLLANSWPDADTLLSYLRSPGDIIAEPFFLGSAAFCFLAWAWAITITEGFKELALNSAEMRYYLLPVRDRPQIERPSTPFRSNAFEAFGRHFLWGAILITCFAAVSTIEVAQLTESNWRNIGRLPFPPGMLLALLAFFGSGFALLSQARLAVLSSKWLYGRADKTIAIEQSWVRQTGWLLGIIGTIAAFLPLGSTTLIGRLLELIIRLIFYLGALFTFLFFSFIALLFPDDGVEPEAPADTFEFQPPPSIEAFPSVGTSEPGFPILGTIFWIIAGIATIMAIIFFLNDRGIKIPAPNWRKIWGAITTWWRNLWRVVVEQAIDVRDAIITRLVRDEIEPDQNQPWRFIRLNSLSPRQKLRYFYLSTIQRADKGALARQDSETPLEYAAELKEHLPTVEEEIDAVTAGFLQARYDDKEISAADVEQVEPLWKTLRSAIKQQRGVT